MIKGCATIDGSDYILTGTPVSVRQATSPQNAYCQTRSGFVTSSAQLQVWDSLRWTKRYAGGDAACSGIDSVVLSHQTQRYLLLHCAAGSRYLYWSAGENIAWGQQSPELVMNSWMNSTGHRQNILNSTYTRLALGTMSKTADLIGCRCHLQLTESGGNRIKGQHAKCVLPLCLKGWTDFNTPRLFAGTSHKSGKESG